MNLFEFVQNNCLREADAIILRKKFLGMVDHYAIYVGLRHGTPQFVANYNNGVQVVPMHEMGELMTKLEPREIERFPGNNYERKEALKRALSRIGEKAYSYVRNNCEHFKNWVHYGINSSDQVDKAGNIALGVGVGVGVLAIAKKYPKLALVGLVVVLIGLGLKDAAEEE